MKFLIPLLLTFTVYAGTGAIPSGDNIKLLKDNLRFKSTDTKIMTNSSDDPTVVAVDAEKGSIYIKSDDGAIYRKTDSGSSTNWTSLISGGGVTGGGTDNNVARWDGSSNIQDSLFTITDSGEGGGLTSLTVDDIVLNSNVISSSLDIVITPASNVQITTLNASEFVVTDGSSNLTTQSAIDLTSDVTGVLPEANGGTGESTASSGELLIGDGSGFTKAGITGTTNQVSVANGAGSITLSTPQDIHSGASPTFAGATISGLTASQFVVTDGASGLASQAAIDMTSDVTGVLPEANGGTGESTAANGELLIGDGSGFTKAGLTGTANQISVTNGAGTITLATPQDIATDSSPTFADVTTTTASLGDIEFTGNIISSTASSGDIVFRPIGTGVSSMDSVMAMVKTAPANAPPATHNYLYFKEDGNLYKKNSSAIEQRVGEKDLDIFYSEAFEGSTSSSNFTTGNHATFLSGGTFIGSVADETTDELAGGKSISYTQSTGSLGDYIVSPAITLQDKQASSGDIGISFAYKYNGSDDDIKFVVVDQSNNILTSTLDLLKSATNSKRFSASAYVPAETTSIRYGFQVLAENNAKELIVDDVQLSTNPFVYKDLTEITDWESAGEIGLVDANASSFSKGTIVQDEIWQRRVGDSMEVKFEYEQSASGSGGSGDYLISIPNGYSIDTDKLSRTSFSNNDTRGAVLGGCKVTNTSAESTTGEVGVIVPYSSTQVRCLLDKASGNLQFWGSDKLGLGATVIHAQGIFTVPIDNWAATSEHVVTPAKSNLTDWTEYTPTTQGIGTPSMTYARWKRVGDTMLMNVKFITGTVSGSELQIGLPSGYTVASYIPDAVHVGTFQREAASAVQLTALATGGDTFLNMGSKSSGGGGNTYTPLAGNVEFGSTEEGSVYAIVPIEEWVNDAATFLAAVPVQRTAYISDQKSSNTQGGTFTSGSYQTRDLNTVEGDTSFVSLSSNQITLPKGKYKIEAWATGYRVNKHKARFQNITDGSTAIVGSSAYSEATDAVTNTSVIDGTIEISDSKTFELQHRCSTTYINAGFGQSSGFGENEIYSMVKITKLR